MQDLMKFEVDLEDTTYEVDLEDITKISKDLNLEIEQHPGIYAWHSQLCEKAQAEYEQAKEELLRQEAALYIEYKKLGTIDGIKVTEKLIDSAIVLHELRIEAKDIELRKKELYRKLQAGREALQQKKDLLSTLSANIRKDEQNS